MKKILKRLIPSNIIKQIIKIKNVFRYPFLDNHEKAVLKWLYRNYDKKRFDYSLNNGIVFDVGGYKGDYTASLLKNNPNIVSYIFEPVYEYAKNIKSRFATNPNIHVFQVGLSNQNKELQINLNNDGSSFLRQSGSLNNEITKIIDVKEFIEKNKIFHIDLMKLNIEGAEYELLERIIDTQLVNRIDNILVQFHKIDKNSEERMFNIQNKLSITHRRIWSVEPFVWESWKKKKDLLN